MTHRKVFGTDSIATAAKAVDIARAAGIADTGISVVARADIELDAIPDDLKLADTDFVPAALRGAGYGAIAGTLAGLVAAVIPPLGLTVAGAMLGGGAAGLLVGTWASSMVGSSVPGPLHQHFEAQIEAGRIFVVLDGSEERLDAVEPHLAAIGATVVEVDGHVVHPAANA